MARKRTNPPSEVGRYLLPITLLKRIEENATKKTGGNKSRLVIELFEGRMTLDPKEEEI